MYFAAERTLLAWLRTGLTIIGLGFVVSRFRLFVQVMTNGAPSRHGWITSAVGLGLVVVGTLVIAGAAAQHLRFCRTLSDLERPAKYWMGFAVWVSLLVALAGASLTIVLAVT